MTETAETTRTLSPTDVKAIKKADTVVLRYHKGVPTIEASLKVDLDRTRIFSASEQRTFPEVDSYDGSRTRTITVYGSIWSYSDSLGGTSDRIDPENAAGFWMTSAAQYNATWSTIASLLRAGDEVTIAFVGNANSNDLTREAHLHADKVQLVVQRGAKKMTFQVDVSVARNNSARMVKAQG